MENLNKQNFWNSLEKRYPKEVKHFCDWIDVYKKDNKWDDLFNKGCEIQVQIDQGNGTKDFFSVAPKFHEIPLAMQFGILIQYFTTLNPHIEIDPNSISIPFMVENQFAIIHEYNNAKEISFKDGEEGYRAIFGGSD